jgi:hypothetical protein
MIHVGQLAKKVSNKATCQLGSAIDSEYIQNSGEQCFRGQADFKRGLATLFAIKSHRMANTQVNRKRAAKMLLSNTRYWRPD